MSGVVVTGGASGVGEGCAEGLVAEGRDGVLWGLSPAGTDVANVFGMTGIALDVTHEAAVAAAVEQSVAALGVVDGLVHAAGTVSVDPIGQLTTELWDKVMNVNLLAFAMITQALLPSLREASNPSVV